MDRYENNLWSLHIPGYIFFISSSDPACPLVYSDFYTVFFIDAFAMGIYTVSIPSGEWYKTRFATGEGQIVSAIRHIMGSF